jgi:hypothetical protein
VFKDLFRNEGSQTFSYSRGTLFKKVLESLKKNKWVIRKQDKKDGLIKLRTGWSTYSYGESILITFKKISKRKTRMNIISRNVGGTFIGFIKDHKNVQKLMKEFEEDLKIK